MKTMCMVHDIIFKSKIYETARHLGAEVAFVDSYEQCGGAGKIIVDLEQFGIEGAHEFRQQNPKTKMIGYLSHVNTDLKAQALRAGFDLVLARSEFSAKVAQILV
mgnify:CR=1 FL=1